MTIKRCRKSRHPGCTNSPVIPDAQRSGIQLLGLAFNLRDYSWHGGLLDTGSEPARASGGQVLTLSTSFKILLIRE